MTVTAQPFEDVPGLAGPVGLLAIGLASFLFVGLPLLGWLLRRVIGARVGRRPWTAAWNAESIALRALRSSVLTWSVIAGALAASSVLPLESGLDAGVKRSLYAVLTLSFTLFTARVVADVIRAAADRSERKARSTSMFVNLARIGVGAIGLLVLLQNLGVSITPMLTALGIGGLAIALALQETLTNFFAGLQIIATKKVNAGDFIKLDSGEEGVVADIDWRHTSVRQLPNTMVLVPNAKLANTVITNYDYPQHEMAVLVDVGVSYDSDLEQVERVTIDVAKNVLTDVPGGVAEFEPFIRFHTFNEFSIDFTTILRVKGFIDQFQVRHEFVKRLHQRYQEEGIVIPFPIRTVDWPQARSLVGEMREDGPEHPRPSWPKLRTRPRSRRFFGPR